MKTIKIFFIVLSLLFIHRLSAQSLKNVEGNPINVAVSLMHRQDTVTMSSICNYYGYTRQPSQDGYTVFTHPNGSNIRYKYTEPNQQFPTIEVTSKIATKEKKQILQNLKFEKRGNTYEQKSIGNTIHCQFTPQGTLILTRIDKIKQ